MSVQEFWDSTILEINDRIESYRRRKEKERKEALANGFVFAQSTAEQIGRYINSENTVRQPWDFFPEMFEEERKVYEEAEKKRQMETARENRKAYAAARKRRQEQGFA